MRPTTIALGAAAALALAGVAGAAGGPSTLVARAPVVALSADGPVVAVATGASRRDCDRVVLWDLRSRGSVRLGRRTSCERTSTGTGIAQVSVAGRRALWLHYTGGNIREWTLWTATAGRPQPRRLAARTSEPEAPAPIVLGEGDASSRAGDVLAWAAGRRVTVLRADGRRAATWTAPAAVTALGAAAGALAVASADGRVTVLEAGAVSDTWTADPPATAVFVTGSGVVAQRDRLLDVRGPAAWRPLTLPPEARLTGASGQRAVYVADGAVHLLDLATGHDRVVARGRATSLDGARLTTASGSHVVSRLLP